METQTVIVSRTNSQTRQNRLTPGGDGEDSVRGGGPVDIRGVPDRAGVGAIVVQGGMEQHYSGVPPGGAALPLDTPLKLPVSGGEDERGKVEELRGRTRMK